MINAAEARRLVKDFVTNNINFRTEAVCIMALEDYSHEEKIAMLKVLCRENGRPFDLSYFRAKPGAVDLSLSTVLFNRILVERVKVYRK